ncbi:hypothetical protein D1AOALGA4SA_10658 [Olavius algarvensis Delta 1 endosymbiont]|nr:hypothetical protein D1AOALGA4SA_10658 [Olavius algarvensis Delta 1 endosymbiont]
MKISGCLTGCRFLVSGVRCQVSCLLKAAQTASLIKDETAQNRKRAFVPA